MQLGSIKYFNIGRSVWLNVLSQKCTKYSGQQRFDVPDSPTGHGEKGFSKTTNTDGDRSPDVSDTRSHCRQSTRNQTTRVRTASRVRGVQKRSIALLPECAVQARSIALLPECAEYRTSLSARINQKTRLVVRTNKNLALLRVRGEGQHNTIREVTLDEDRHEYRTAHVRGMTSTPQCAMKRQMESDDAALFQMGQPKGQLLNRFCDHHELLDYTSRFACGATKHEREHMASQKCVSQNRVSTVLSRELINSDARTKKRTGKFCNSCVQVTRVFNIGS